jgi:biotin carboxyl carrier protein
MMETVKYCVNDQAIEINQNDHSLEVNGKHIQVQLISTPNGKVKMLLNDEVLAFNVVNKDLNGMLLEKDGMQYHVSKENGAAEAKEEEKSAAAPTDTITIKAPLPGVVIKLAVNPGDSVKKDDVVLVVESMKMQIDVRSTAAGTVKAVLVNPGDQVEVDMAVVELA